MNVFAKLSLILFSSVVLFSSCKGKKGSGEFEMNLTEAKGGRYYGGVLRLNESEFIKTLYPPNITDGFSMRIASQIYEGLFKFDQSDLSVKKCLVEDYSVDETGKIYTFKLKKGVYFHDNACFQDGKGREMKASDVAFCFTQLCKQDANNQGFIIFKNTLKGADEHFVNSAGGKTPTTKLGIEIIDDYTLKMELVKPNALFITNLARPFAFIYPKEAFEKYGLEMRSKAVGTGPFYLSSMDEDISIILKKNPKYYGQDQNGNQLPFLEAVDIKFIKDKKTELFEFKKGNIDMIYRLPTEYIIEILEETGPDKSGEYSQFELQRKPEMATQFLTFMSQNEVFKNKDLRKAISFAIDREKILNFVLNGEGFYPGFNGITPPTFTDYKTEEIKGYKLNTDSARYYLAKAGYPGGKGFPEVTLQLNSEGERHSNVAIEIQKQLKENLNINIKLEVVPFAQLVENIISGKTGFFRSGYIADYPSPENFLALFYGKDVPKSLNEKSFPNFARFTNPEFDRLYEAGLSAKTTEESYSYFLQAEKLLMAEAPIIVLWYDEGYRLLQSNVKNFPNNPMQLRDYSEVYFEKVK
ncbi:MAG: ABC transporter substrate-binding protein, partial [Cytophagales bacterium]